MPMAPICDQIYFTENSFNCQMMDLSKECEEGRQAFGVRVLLHEVIWVVGVFFKPLGFFLHTLFNFQDGRRLSLVLQPNKECLFLTSLYFFFIFPVMSLSREECLVSFFNLIRAKINYFESFKHTSEIKTKNLSKKE